MSISLQLYRIRTWVVFALFLGGVMMAQAAGAAFGRLPKLRIAPDQITVSGVSSGGFMAVQMHIAHSDVFSGAASVAGGIYWCAEGNMNKAQTQCMASPQKIQVRRYVDRAIEDAREGRIASLENLRNDRVYLFSGTKDRIIAPAGTDKLKEFYLNLVPAANVTSNTGSPTAHGFPTVDFGSACDKGGSPWLLKCGTDSAAEILKSLYGPLNPPDEASAKHLYRFDQTEFGSQSATMYDLGSVYIPQACAKGAACRLHVALHGCQMNPDFIGDDFVIHSGLNRWAEANHIVVLYPSSAKSFSNPYACWDWYGFTGSDYATRDGRQVRVLKAMIDRLTGKTEYRQIRRR